MNRGRTVVECDGHFAELVALGILKPAFASRRLFDIGYPLLSFIHHWIPLGGTSKASVLDIGYSFYPPFVIERS